MLRKIDAQLAQWCDGQHTVEELAQLAQQSGSSLTVEMVADLIRRMTALGIIEEAAAAGEPAPAPPAALPSYDDDIQDSGDEEPKTQVGFAMDPAMLAALSAPRADAAPKITAPKITAPKMDAPKQDAPPRRNSLSGMPKVTGEQPAARSKSATNLQKVEAAQVQAPAPAPRRNSLANVPAIDNPPTDPAMSAPKKASQTAPAVEAPRRNSLSGMPAVEAPKKTSQTAPAVQKSDRASSAALPPVKKNATPARPTPAPAMPFDEPNAAPPPPPNLVDAFGEGKDYDTDMVKLDAAKGASTPADKLEQQLQALSSLSMDSSAAPSAPSSTPSSSPSGSSKLPWILLALVVVGGGGFFAYSKLAGGPATDNPQDNPNLPKVRIEVVRADGRKGQTLLAAGYLSAPKIISMGTTEGGRIKKIFVENGSKVKKNQLLIQFDDSAATAELKLAGAKLGTANRALKRARQLFQAQAATANDVDAALGAVSIASAEYNVKQQVVDQCKIKSPINGTVIDVPVHEGEVIKGDSTGGALLKLADLTEMLAEVDVNEADLPLIRIGQPADAKTDATGDKAIPGKVKEISQQADRAKGTVVVKVSITEVPETVRPGMSVKVAFREDDSATKRILLPRAAVIEGRVFVVEGGRAVSRPVAYLASGPSTVEISSGVKEGDRVVVEGAASLQDGQQVQ